MKALKFTGKILLGILALIYFAFVLFNTILLLNINKYRVSELGDKTILTVKNEVSTDKYEKGDIVIAEKRRLEDYKVGDDLFIYKVQKTGAPLIDYGVIGTVHKEEEVISFENGATYDSKFIAGVPTKVIPNLGTILDVIQSTWGFFFIVLAPSFLIFIYELYAIVVEIKYGSPEKIEE